MFFSQEAKSLGPWSPSKVEAAEKCPWQFHAQHIENLQIPPDKEIALKDDKLRIGSAVHKYAELRSLGKPKEESALKAKTSNKLMAKEEQVFETHLDSVEAFNDKINAFKVKHNVTKDLREFKMGVTPELAPTGFFDKDVFLRGVIDRLLIINDEFAIPIDLKTSDRPTLNYSKLQLAIYCLFILVKWPTIRMVHPALFFVGAEEFLWSEKVYRDFATPKEDHLVIHSINEAAASVSSAPAPKKGKHCDWCKFKNLCPLFQK